MQAMPGQEQESKTSSRESLQRRYHKHSSRLYQLLRPPLPVFHNPAESRLPDTNGLSLWIGAAGQKIPEGFIGVDLVQSTGVDIVADVENLPFASLSISRIECDAVLEHVQHPATAVKEMLRVLRIGGHIHVVVPFCHPLHLYPADYTRWTIDGLRELLTDFEVVDIGVRTGPTATLLTTILEYLKVISPRSLRKPVYAAAAWILWPLRYADKWLLCRPEAQVLANSIYVLARRVV